MVGEGVGSGLEVFVAITAVLLGAAVASSGVLVGLSVWRSVGGGVVFILVGVGVTSNVLVEAAAGEHAAVRMSKKRLNKMLWMYRLVLMEEVFYLD